MAKVIPVFRIFDYDKAFQFYQDWLGFKIDHGDWSNDEEDSGYVNISRGDITLQLTANKYYAPGAGILIDDFENVEKYYTHLAAKLFDYDVQDLGLFREYYDELMDPDYKGADYEYKFLMEDDFLEIVDPFGNRLSFNEPW